MMRTKKEKKKREPRRKRLKVDLTKLPDAIVDGAFVAAVKERVYFERTFGKDTEIHEGTVWKVDGATVTVWDDTRQQFWYFSLNEPHPVIKRRDAPSPA